MITDKINVSLIFCSLILFSHHKTKHIRIKNLNINSVRGFFQPPDLITVKYLNEIFFFSGLKIIYSPSLRIAFSLHILYRFLVFLSFTIVRAFICKPGGTSSELAMMLFMLFLSANQLLSERFKPLLIRQCRQQSAKGQCIAAA